MTQLVLSRHWNPKEVRSNASGGMDFLARQEQAGKEQKLSSSKALCRLPADGVARMEGVSSCLKIQSEGVYLPTSKVSTRSPPTSKQAKYLSQVSPPILDCVHPRYS